MLKRFRRKFVVSVASVMLLFGATSVLAYDGWADTIHDAYPLNGPIYGVSTTINSSADVDWYKFPHVPGGSNSLTVQLQSPPGLNYDLHIVYSPDGVNFYGAGAAPDNGPGGIDAMGMAVPNGGVYFQVRGKSGTDFSPTAQYTITVTPR